MTEYIVVAIWEGKREHAFTDSMEEAVSLREDFLQRKAFRAVIAEVLEG